MMGRHDMLSSNPKGACGGLGGRATVEVVKAIRGIFRYQATPSARLCVEPNSNESKKVKDERENDGRKSGLS
jgi:hypothetical protein